jgi:hypothetical protein
LSVRDVALASAWDGAHIVWDAQVAETDYVAFTGRRTAEHVACRLIVRRVNRIQQPETSRNRRSNPRNQLFSSCRAITMRLIWFVPS